MLDEQAGDLLLALAPAGPPGPRLRPAAPAVRILPHVDEAGRGGHQVEDGGADEAVVQDDVGPGQERGAPPGQEPGVTGAGTHQVDGHGPVSRRSSKPSTAAPPPSSRARATSAPTASGSRPDRVRRITVCPSALARSPDTRKASPASSGTA